MLAWLSLGSNMGNPNAQVRGAVEQLRKTAQLEVLEVSSFYLTPPWGEEQQSDFVNAVVKISTRLEPLELLHHSQAIENAMGRKRDGRRWGPRVIDIDILLYADLQLNTDVLVVPHPRMHERAFVLLPMAEIDDSVDIPGHGKVALLLGKLDTEQIRRL